MPEGPVVALSRLEPVRKSDTVTTALDKLGAPGLTSVNSSCAVTCRVPTWVDTQSKVKGIGTSKLGPAMVMAPAYGPRARLLVGVKASVTRLVWPGASEFIGWAVTTESQGALVGRITSMLPLAAPPRLPRTNDTSVCDPPTIVPVRVAGVAATA